MLRRRDDNRAGAEPRGALRRIGSNLLSYEAAVAGLGEFRLVQGAVVIRIGSFDVRDILLGLSLRDRWVVVWISLGPSRIAFS